MPIRAITYNHRHYGHNRHGYLTIILLLFPEILLDVIYFHLILYQFIYQSQWNGQSNLNKQTHTYTYTYIHSITYTHTPTYTQTHTHFDTLIDKSEIYGRWIIKKF